MRLINANTLKGEFTGNFIDAYPTALVHAIIDSAPTIDAVPVVHGYWIKNSGNSYTVKCSICKSERISSDSWFEYCPRCGAKMGGETNGIN